ncbi:sigma 54-interacting transcriptional regulator [Pseudoduganella sp. RAF19]|uniref:sigma-54 dependent transcriptional regulator n=1 Tax=Pseudoduganella sp. RAF19 TaxID=3233052 RepID=UPI003F98E975
MKKKQLLCVALEWVSQEELSAFLHDWDIYQASSLVEARSLLRSKEFLVGLLLVDVRRLGVEALDSFLREHWQVKWVSVFRSAALNLPAFRQLMVEQCFDFHTSPIDFTRLSHTLGHVHGLASLQSKPDPASADAMSLVGVSPALAALRQNIRKVSGVPAPVLIWGESGTGKELVARAVHTHSQRASAPFVPVNCGAIPSSLIQAELFGYERGAFTGASRDKCGLIETAAGGTVFFDEIADLPLDMQSNLLRFLQERTIHRLGSTRGTVVDARVIAASHIRLIDAVRAGRFREDLFYRLNVLTLETPPLRQRREDILPLAEHFFKEFAAERAASVKGFGRDALRAIHDYAWPGNVRELVNRVRRASVMAEGRLIRAHDLGLDGKLLKANNECLDGARTRAERQAIETRLEAGKSMTSVARELGVSRMTLYRLMSKHGIELPTKRAVATA